MPAKEIVVVLLLQMAYKLESFPGAEVAPCPVILVSMQELATQRYIITSRVASELGDLNGGL